MKVTFIVTTHPCLGVVLPLLCVCRARDHDRETHVHVRARIHCSLCSSTSILRYVQLVLLLQVGHMCAISLNVSVFLHCATARG